MTELRVNLEAGAVIKSSRGLAGALSMDMTEREGVRPYLRAYEKPIKVEGGSGWEVLTVQDTGLASNAASERFSLGVKLDSPFWKDLTDIMSLGGDWGGLAINRGFGFDKKSLIALGYGAIYNLVRRKEEEGFFEAKLAGLIEEYTFARRVADEVTTKFRQVSGETVWDRFDEGAEIVFYDKADRQHKTVRVVSVSNFASGIEVNVGRARLTKLGSLDEEAFRRARLYTVWFPLFTSNPEEKAWRYVAGDWEMAQKQVELALTALTEYLAKKK